MTPTAASSPPCGHRSLLGRLDRTGVWLTALALGTGAHALACVRAPHDSGDLSRQVVTALLANRDGWSGLNQPIAEWAPSLAGKISWGEVPYNYPPILLLFFQAVAWFSPTLFAAKLALTLVEAVNATLVARFCADWRAGVLYWCLPLSIWWVSREGASEPVQNCLLLLTLLAWKTHRVCAPAALVLAGQTKLMGVFLTPWLLWTSWRETRGPVRIKATLLVLLAVLPTALAALAYPVFTQVFHIAQWGAKFNVYHWRALFDPAWRWWLPFDFVACVQLATTVVLGWIVVQFVRRRAHPLPWLGAVLFLLAAKNGGVFQPWYFLAFIPLWLVAVAPDRRLVWLAVTQFCEPLSLWRMLVTPAGTGAAPHVFGLFETIALA